MKLKSAPPPFLPRSRMNAMNATAALDSSALNAKNVRSERGVTKASEFIRRMPSIAQARPAAAKRRWAPARAHDVPRGQARAGRLKDLAVLLFLGATIDELSKKG